MRLHHGMNFAFGHLAGRLKDSGNLNGMMSVIINNAHAVPISDMGEAPLDPAKAIKPRADLRFCQAKFAGDRNRGQDILRIMLARHGKEQSIPAFLITVSVTEDRIETRACRFQF